MDDHVIAYRLTPEADATRELALTFDAERFTPIGPAPDAPPEWAALAFRQCPHCPLDPDRLPHCPLAVRLAPVVERFGALISCDRVHLEVTLRGKRITAATSAQRAMGSLMGLAIAGSECPYTLFLRPMARFHVPLAGRAETLFRAAATYLLGQSLRRRNGLGADFDMAGLAHRYRQLETVNAAVAERLRAASRTDASVNAIILLDTYAKAVPMVIDADLEELRPLFAPYLSPDPPDRPEVPAPSTRSRS